MGVGAVTYALLGHGLGLARDGWLRAKELVAKQANARNAGVLLVCSIAAAGIVAAALGFCFLLLFLATCAIVPLVLATACLAGLACLWSSLVCCCAAFCAACFASWVAAGLLAARTALSLLERLGLYTRPRTPTPATRPTPTHPSTDPLKPSPTPTPAPTPSPNPLPHAGTKHPRPSDPPTLSPTPLTDRPHAPLPTFGRTAPPAPRPLPTPKRRKSRPPSKRPYPELLHVYTFSLDSTPPSDSEPIQPPPTKRAPLAPLPPTATTATTWGSPNIAPAAINGTAPAPQPTPIPQAPAATATPSPAVDANQRVSTPAPQPPQDTPPAAATTATAPGVATATAPTSTTTQAMPKGAVSTVQPSFDDISLPLIPQLPPAWLRALPARLPTVGGSTGRDACCGVQLALLPHTAAFAAMRQKQE